ncbi:MAG: glutamate--tRNA ligase [Deltaproteobacteria bacterium CG07_land_8_20_14_0_80_38_7]|nr:MAG: glutamate--tRNA ligase [Deltaproteobacteria bacterium CG07_land_8_20_14_0_80_38_7]
MNTKQVRVRFAPSPTGALHIGGARTALFNWLFARNQGGTLILRIEDTDLKRSTKEYTESILDGLNWLGLDWDEGPYYQTERIDLYKEHIERLLEQGKAYKCYCTAEELDNKRKALMASSQKPKYDGTCRNRTDEPNLPYTIRLKAPQEGITSIDDVCRGHIEFNNKELDDLIIARSDGSPTYNLTVVVDDVTMNISHVIRGDDHLNNTPRQALIYEAFGYPLPIFVHLPMIHGADKKKLSKRHGATSVIEYKDMGFLPSAMINYLARLGWSYKDQEIFTKAELIEKFDLSVVGKSPSIFDTEKLTWINSQHMLKYSNEELVNITTPYLEKLGLKIEDRDYAAKALASERERGKTLLELADISAFYFKTKVDYNEEAKAKWLNEDGKKILESLKEKLKNLDEFTNSNIEDIFKEITTQTGFKMLKVAQPLRVAMTGTTVIPGIFEVLSILGKKEVMKRIDEALKG